MGIKIEDLTLGEIAKVEELSGQSINRIGEDEAPQGLALAALVFVAKRREDPKFGWNDACGYTFPQASEFLGFTADDEAGDEPDPTPPPARTRRKPTT